MTTQVDNGQLYLAQYAAPAPEWLRVEIRIRDKGVGSEAADVSWKDFKEIVRLGQQLIQKCETNELLAALQDMMQVYCQPSTAEERAQAHQRAQKAIEAAGEVLEFKKVEN